MERLSTQPGTGLCYYNARAATAKPLLVPRHLSVLRPQANTRCGAHRRTHKPSSTRGGRRVPPQPHRNGSCPSAIRRRYAEAASEPPPRLYGLFPALPLSPVQGGACPVQPVWTRRVAKDRIPLTAKSKGDFLWVSKIPRRVIFRKKA